MYKIKLFNNIAPIGINTFDNQYDVSETIENEDAILVRSANLFNLDYNPNLKSIARAGAGVNNIDIESCTNRGIVVFNTPRSKFKRRQRISLCRNAFGKP